MPTLHLNIGSNSGDRQALIGAAVAAVSAFFVHADIRVSDTIESDPWGFGSPNKFLNVGMAVTADSFAEPQELMCRILSIQNSVDPAAHRNADGTYRDRPIDIDIIALDDMVVASDTVTIPHPRMHLRPFVLIPLKQLAPGWRHPLLGRTAEELLNAGCVTAKSTPGRE